MQPQQQKCSAIRVSIEDSQTSDYGEGYNISSLAFLVGIVVGGLASISGALYGALFIQFVPNVADELSKAAPWAIYGVFLIGFMYLMPSGVAGLIQVIRRRFPRK